MKIKILKSCSGYHFSFKQDDVETVEDYIGKDLVNCGFAEELEETPAEISEENPPKSSRKRAVKKNACT